MLVPYHLTCTPTPPPICGKLMEIKLPFHWLFHMIHPFLENFCHFHPYLRSILLGDTCLGNFAITFDRLFYSSSSFCLFFSLAFLGLGKWVPPFVYFSGGSWTTKNTLLRISQKIGLKDNHFSGHSQESLPETHSPKLPPFPRKWEHACSPFSCRGMGWDLIHWNWTELWTLIYCT